MRPGEQRLRRLLRRWRRPDGLREPPLPLRPAAEWRRSMEAHTKRIERRLARLERLVSGGVAVTLLVEVALRLAQRWAP